MIDPETQVWVFPMPETSLEIDKIACWAKRRGMRAYDAIDRRLSDFEGFRCNECHAFYTSYEDVNNQYRLRGYTIYYCDKCGNELCMKDHDAPLTTEMHTGMQEGYFDNCIVVMKCNIPDEETSAYERTCDDDLDDPDTLPEPQQWQDFEHHLFFPMFHRDNEDD